MIAPEIGGELVMNPPSVPCAAAQISSDLLDSMWNTESHAKLLEQTMEVIDKPLLSGHAEEMQTAGDANEFHADALDATSTTISTLSVFDSDELSETQLVFPEVVLGAVLSVDVMPQEVSEVASMAPAAALLPMPLGLQTNLPTIGQDPKCSKFAESKLGLARSPSQDSTGGTDGVYTLEVGIDGAYTFEVCKA